VEYTGIIKGDDMSDQLTKLFLLRNEEMKIVAKEADTLDGATRLVNRAYEMTGEKMSVNDAISHIAKVNAVRRMSA
jgi:hypothetical protein